MQLPGADVPLQRLSGHNGPIGPGPSLQLPFCPDGSIPFAHLPHHRQQPLHDGEQRALNKHFVNNKILSPLRLLTGFTPLDTSPMLQGIL